MTRKIAAAVGLMAAIGTSLSPAAALSCRDHFNACVRNETRMRLPASRCDKPLKACLAQCKSGKAAFVGPSTGNRYPATECP